MKHKVIFIIVPSYSDNNWLDAKMMQITKAFISILNIDNYPVAVVKDYNDCNEFLNLADFLIVVTAGTVIAERDHLYTKIKNLDQDTGLLAHILQFAKDDTPYIHEQFFIINTKAINSIDLNFNQHQKIDKELIRSVEDMHDGHAPLFVELGDREINLNLQFGTSLILECLKNGYRVRNFDQDWRYPELANDYVILEGHRLPTRGYCYPKLNSNLFAQSLRDLKVRQGLDEAQELFISAVNKILEYKVLNYWQYEQTPKNIETAKRIICPATGFLAEMMALRTGARKIIFYDINKNNLEFKKHLYKNWNGIDYEAFAKSWAKDRGLALEPTFGLDRAYSEILIEQTENILFPVWKILKEHVAIEYIHADLIKDSDKVLEQADKDAIIHTSTILGVYPFTAIMHTEDEIDLVKRRIVETQAQWINL